ncbi:NifC-like ABC-type porter [Methanocaldococcus infernus ME]|uniref:NifC-like ABC-type porter n=1 Tax=Methanocaldococcus infernus (strain DSM 11812 / JCM 15783 / ME) TaxID=573063 RepID=D5VQJ9_METIM|nr:ABC transporter permease [Methanocaldococcus infernus]ADG12852.1 NifC-like ABC-type porter [Methanocaldococcus infernus ME]
MKALESLSLLTLAFFILFVLTIILTIFLNISINSLLHSLTSDEVRFATLLSIKCSIVAILLASLIGVPSAYFLARHSFPGREVIDSLINLPILLPPLVSGFSLLIFLGNSPIGKFVNSILPLIFTPNGIILAQFFIATPFIIKTSRAIFESIDIKYEYIAQSLGCSKLESFFRVLLPMAKNGIIAGIILGWARAFGEFGATLMLAGATKFRTETLPTAIFLNVSIGNIDLALTISLIHIVIAILVILSIKLILGRSYEC